MDKELPDVCGRTARGMRGVIMEVGNPDKIGAAGEPWDIIVNNAFFPPLPLCVGGVVCFAFSFIIFTI